MWSVLLFIYYNYYIVLPFYNQSLQGHVSWPFLTKYIVYLFFENLRVRNCHNLISDMNNNKNMLIHIPIVIIT